MKKQGYYCTFFLRHKSRRYKRKWLKHEINTARRENVKMKDWGVRVWTEENDDKIAELTTELKNL